MRVFVRFFLCSFVDNFGSIYFYTISIQPNLQTDPSLSGKKPQMAHIQMIKLFRYVAN